MRASPLPRSWHKQLLMRGPSTTSPPSSSAPTPNSKGPSHTGSDFIFPPPMLSCRCSCIITKPPFFCKQSPYFWCLGWLLATSDPTSRWEIRIQKQTLNFYFRFYSSPTDFPTILHPTIVYTQPMSWAKAPHVAQVPFDPPQERVPVPRSDGSELGGSRGARGGGGDLPQDPPSPPGPRRGTPSSPRGRRDDPIHCTIVCPERFEGRMSRVIKTTHIMPELTSVPSRKKEFQTGAAHPQLSFLDVAVLLSLSTHRPPP